MSRDGLTRDGRYRLSLRSRIRYGPMATRISNWRNRKAITRGRRDAVARAGDQVRSRTPVLRNRIDPSTGRPNRDARRIGWQRDVTLGWRQTHRAPMPRTKGRSR
jgi:hypothetical protein